MTTTHRPLRDELLTVDHPEHGRMLLVVPVIPEDAPYRVREGIARRRLTAITGTCPCGASVDYTAAVAGVANVAEVQHARLCPADTGRLVRELRRWVR